MIDLIELVDNLLNTFDKHFLPFLNKKFKLLHEKFKNEFYKKFLILHMEENKKVLDKINQTKTIKNELEKNNVNNEQIKKYESEIIKLQNELNLNNLQIEKLKGKIKND